MRLLTGAEHGQSSLQQPQSWGGGAGDRQPPIVQMGKPRPREGGTRQPVQGTEHGGRRARTSSSQACEYLLSGEARSWPRVWAGSGPFPSLPDSISVLFSLLQFLLIFRKAAAGELQEDSGLHVLARLSEIDVSTEGVKGAKSFFEAKVRNMGGGVEPRLGSP